MISLRSKIRWWAIYSRGFVIILQILSNLIIKDHEPDDTFTWVTLEPGNQAQDSFIDQLVSLICDGFVRWDAHHFLHIANNGYTFENNLAFFPIYPLCVQVLASVAHWFVKDSHVITYVSLLKLSGLYINFICFILSAEILYLLSRRVLRDECLAYRSALFYCVNPASVFFSAYYSETLFALFTFSSLLRIEIGLGFWSGIFLALASATRANGVVNAGFVFYKSMKLVAAETILYVRATNKKKDHKKFDFGQKIPSILTSVMLPGIINIFLCLGSFAAFQWFSFNTFCNMKAEHFDFPKAIVSAAKSMKLVLPGSSTDTWCQNDHPIAYHYIQSHYWNVGLLNYWDGKQWPQFALAAPVIGLCLWQLYLFYQVNSRFTKCLGLVDNTLLGLTKPKDQPVCNTLALPRSAFVYICHAAFLILFGLFFAHVQITTRMICSSSPLLYWFAAVLSLNSQSQLVPIDLEKEKNSNPTILGEVWLRVENPQNLNTRHLTILLQESAKDLARSHWIKMYFLGYTLIGTVLFANHFPWT